MLMATRIQSLDGEEAIEVAGVVGVIIIITETVIITTETIIIAIATILVQIEHVIRAVVSTIYGIIVRKSSL